jgi:hypothetical protein
MKRLAGYSSLWVAISLLAASTLAAQPRDSALLKTKVKPGRAGVFVDGKYLGPAANFKVARKYTLSPGRHEIRLVDPRYQEVSTTMNLVAGETTVLSETLKPLPPPKGPFGTLRTISSDKFAAVYINEKFYGHADEFSNPAQGVLLPPGEYTVRIEPLSGKSPASEQVQIEAGKTVVIGN